MAGQGRARGKCLELCRSLEEAEGKPGKAKAPLIGEVSGCRPVMLRARGAGGRGTGGP
jgi:hypothetical protein